MEIRKIVNKGFSIISADLKKIDVELVIKQIYENHNLFIPSSSIKLEIYDRDFLKGYCYCIIRNAFGITHGLPLNLDDISKDS